MLVEFSLLFIFLALAVLIWKLFFNKSESNVTQTLEEKHRQIIVDINDAMNKLSDRLHNTLSDQEKSQNETFVNVAKTLATIDEAQKKIDGMMTNMVSLQEILGDKRSRGTYGEIQLKELISNIMPPDSYAFQHTFLSGARVDCALFLPEPTGTIGVDSKFPMENYHKMFDQNIAEGDKERAKRQFKLDVRKHITDISSKYIIPNETSDGAVMFIPAEAVFAEIHGHHPDIIKEAMLHRVWLVSPTTLMAVLNTARAVLKDIETKKQVHIIKSELGKLGQEFERFDSRMKKLTDNISQANDNAQKINITSKKITSRFKQIERVQLDDIDEDLLDLDNTLTEKRSSDD